MSDRVGAPGFDSSARREDTMKEIEFGRLEDARKVRNNPMFQAFLADKDNGREKTVRLKDVVPEKALKDIQGEAAESRQHERQQAGQVALTKTERREIDFGKEGVNIPKARSIKAIAANEGVDDWMAFADLELTVDENRSVLKQGKRQERGQLMDATTTEAFDLDRDARAYQREKTEAFDHAADAAFGGATDAQEEVRQQGLGLLDIGFSRTESGGLRGSGQHFGRLMDIHEDRSKNAQRVDERRQAKTTRDPFQWSAAPDKWDFPGIDTVDPAELHGQRSKRARQKDEKELAPVTSDKEKWAKSPDRWDFAGVDTPDDSGDGGSAWVDDRDRQGSLGGFGLDMDGTTYRESREDVEAATTFGVDDRSDASRGNSKGKKSSEQSGFGDLLGGGDGGGLFGSGGKNKGQKGFEDLL